MLLKDNFATFKAPRSCGAFFFAGGVRRRQGLRPGLR